MRAILTILFSTISLSQGFAQLSEKDSVWLEGIKSGRDSVKLNPEFMRSIQDGTFLNPEGLVGEQQLSPAYQLPICKDFSEYLDECENSNRKVALKDLPPSVFWLYTPKPTNRMKINNSLLEQFQMRISTARSSLASFDMATLTSRKAYIHRRNSKRNATWQNYNNLPTSKEVAKKRSLTANIGSNSSSLPTPDVISKKRMKLITDSLSRDSLSMKVVK